MKCRKTLEWLGIAAFFIMLGIVGTVECGGDIRLLWWTLPCVVVMAADLFAGWL